MAPNNNGISHRLEPTTPTVDDITVDAPKMLTTILWLL